MMTVEMSFEGIDDVGGVWRMDMEKKTGGGLEMVFSINITLAIVHKSE